MQVWRYYPLGKKTVSLSRRHLKKFDKKIALDFQATIRMNMKNYVCLFTVKTRLSA